MLFRNGLAGSLLGLLMIAPLVFSCSSSDSSNSSTGSTPSSATGTTVQVSAAATDDDPGDQSNLHYRWAATEGTIDNVDKSTTTWTIPAGSGLQFAYVLVSDQKGGYTEARAAALTFSAGAEQSGAAVQSPRAPQNTKFIWGALYYDGFGRRVYLPDWDVRLKEIPLQAGEPQPKTDKKGEFFFSGLTAVSYTLQYKIPGDTTGFKDAGIISTTPTATSPSSTGYRQVPVTIPGLAIGGSVRLTDHSYCGIRDEFFTNPNNPRFLPGPISASAELLDNSDTRVGNPRPEATVNHYGDYLIVLEQQPVLPNGPKVRITCENLTQDLPVEDMQISGQVRGPSFILANSRPRVTMTVTLGGRDVGRPDLPTPQTLTSDNSPLPLEVRHEMNFAPGDDAFLTYKGIDTRKGACAYYFKIGAVQGCDEDGFPTGAQLTLDQWQKHFNLSPFHDGNPSEPEFKAIYINKQDLNLARDMQAIKLQRDGGTLAYNVCNYPGPQDVNDPLGTPKLIGEDTEPDRNLAIENAKRGIGKVACVAMDYTPATGVRFYTFSPSGKLLLSISLDGRREKFMPGSCVACHGGDDYGGKFPDTYTDLKSIDEGPGQANIGSYFLPFDVANFYFSKSDPSLSRDKLLAPLRRMNELLASIPGNPATKPIADELKSLITTRWYPPTNTDDEQTNPVPSVYSNQQILGTGTSQCTTCHSSGTPGTLTPGPYNADVKHATAIAPSCQICHTSNFLVADPQAGGSPRITFLERPPVHYLRGSNSAPRGPHTVCGKSRDLKMNHTMPNALGSFERFWLKKETDQPASLFSISPPGAGQQLGACMTPSPHPGL